MNSSRQHPNTNATTPAMSAMCDPRPAFAPPNARNARKSKSVPVPVMTLPTARTTISAR